jgi:hypothetical protein
LQLPYWRASYPLLQPCWQQRQQQHQQLLLLSLLGWLLGYHLGKGGYKDHFLLLLLGSGLLLLRLCLPLLLLHCLTELSPLQRRHSVLLPWQQQEQVRQAASNISLAPHPCQPQQQPVAQQQHHHHHHCC